MSKNFLAGLIIVLVLLAGGFLAYRSYNKAGTSTPPSEINNQTEVTQPESSSSTESSPAASENNKNMVKITANGFDPKIVTIKAGEMVTWTNSDTAMHTVYSSLHPTHTDYTPLNLGNIAAGSSKSLTFPTAGTYKYHDHLNPTLTGTVIVE